MRIKRQFILYAVAIVAVCVASWLVFHSRGPVYHGKSVKAWVDHELSEDDPFRYSGWDGPSVRLPGTRMSYTPKDKMFSQLLAERPADVLPYLIQALKARNTPVGQKYVWLGNHLPRAISSHLPVWPDAYYRHTVAAVIVGSMGSSAKDALPALCENLAKSPCDHGDLWTIHAVVAIGPRGKSDAPMFLKLLQTSPDADVRAMAVVELGVIHTEAPEVLPAILKAMQDSNEIVRWYAGGTMSQFGPEAKSIAPVLYELLASTNIDASALRVILHRIDPTGNEQASR